MRIGLVVEAWAELLYVDLVGRRGFRLLRQIVGPKPIVPASAERSPVRPVVEAVDLALLWYVKRVWCLQYSVAVTRLLRRRGIAAELVVGCHLAPLRGHAWVEVDGEIVAQKQDGLQYFCIVDRW